MALSDWVIADAAPAADEADWVLADAAGAISGVFYNHPASSRPRYAPFGSPDHSLSSLPAAAALAVRAASNGLLCLAGAWSAYYVVNPFTSRLAALPRPPSPHQSLRPVPVLVADGSAATYLLVCALQASPASPIRLEIFSSASGEWIASSAASSVAEPLVSGSGVSSAGVAYWRTKAGAVLAYEPATDEVKVFPGPAGAAVWELAEAGGRLCCCVVNDDSTVELQALTPSGRWEVVCSVPFGEEQAVVPLRYQSLGMEVVLWVDGRIVGMDLDGGETRQIAGLEVPVPGEGVDYVSHTNTLAPVVAAKRR